MDDKNNGYKSLGHIRASVSFIPLALEHKPNPNFHRVIAANDTCIHTYGTKDLTLNTGIRRNFIWTFIQPDVQTTILSVGFEPVSTCR